MQLHLLNFYKLLSEFAVSLVSGFISLIVYQATGSIVLSVGYVVVMSLLRMLFTYVFRKFFTKKPEISLMIRLVPMVAYSVFLIVLESNFWLYLPLLCITYALSVAIKNISTDALFAYATKPNESNKSAMITRLAANFAPILSNVLGGVFLNINSTMLILISAALYVLSVIPLLIYYFRNKKNKSFNKDYTTNVQIEYAKQPIHDARFKKASRNMIRMTFVTTMLSGTGDYVITMYNLMLFVSSGNFALAGYFTAILQATRVLGNLIGNLMARKMDNSLICVIGSLGLAVIIPILPFAKAMWLILLIVALFGFFFEIICYVVFLNTNKARMLGISNEVNIYGRQLGIPAGQALIQIPTMIAGTFPITFFVFSALMVINTIYWPIKEEQVRKQTVDYLMANEITSD